jgi:hypothetical protein
MKIVATIAGVFLVGYSIAALGSKKLNVSGQDHNSALLSVGFRGGKKKALKSISGSNNSG